MPAPTKKPAAPKTRTALDVGLRKLGLERDIDLALHLPLRYEDETRLLQLADVADGDVAHFEATVTDSEVTFRPRRQLVVTVDDGTEVCRLRFLNFYPSHQKTLAIGAMVRLRGEIKRNFYGCEMIHPSFKAAGAPLPQSLTPIYSTVSGLGQLPLRRAVLAGLARAQASGALDETIPELFLDQIGLRSRYPLGLSLLFLHNPTPDVALSTFEDKTHPAWVRLKAEELLAQQLSQAQARHERQRLTAPSLSVNAPATLGVLAQLRAVLPFALTQAQTRVVGEIVEDVQRTQPMHRLLQGDVGSGKTVVAAIAAAQCIDAGWQCALMAPTEILAEQHFRKLIGWLEPLGVKIAWLTGSQGKKDRRLALEMIQSGEAHLVVGTHAVVQDKVVFKRLALAIIDEQHRFGVRQRLALREKMHSPGTDVDASKTQQPHLLMMTATPIPRTLAMSVFADLDVSTIDELPPGRTPVLTKLLNESRKLEVVERIRGQISQGRQVYWVCPLIEESEALDLSNATATHAELSESLPGVTVGLLHSRMAVADKKAVMALFESGQMGLLVSTTVIEVGVDVPNASLMVIEHAERFGLSQLHQLRGRVGRGAAASACVLLYGTPEGGRLGEVARERLKVMAQTNDGFAVAQRDLDIRGPGEFLGARQSGAPLLRFADLATDLTLLNWARSAAHDMLTHHPEAAHAHIARWMGNKAELLAA